MQIKEDTKSFMDSMKEDEDESAKFKARKLNMQIFDKVASLPSIEKKRGTSFETFNLSGSNQKLGKKSLEDYQSE